MVASDLDYDQLLQEALARVEQVRRHAREDDTAAAGPVVQATLKDVARQLHLVRFAMGSWDPDPPVRTDGGGPSRGSASKQTGSATGQSGRGVHRRTVLRGAASAAALASLPGVAASQPDEDLDAHLRRTGHLQRTDATCHAEVALSEAQWEDAVRRASKADRMEELTGYLMNYFTLEFRFHVDGVEVHRTDGFDPDLVIWADGRPDRKGDIKAVTGRADE